MDGKNNYGITNLACVLLMRWLVDHNDTYCMHIKCNLVHFATYISPIAFYAIIMAHNLHNSFIKSS